jgi:hypothetical protein
MRSPNRNNIHLYGFATSACLVLIFTILLKFDGWVFKVVEASFCFAVVSFLASIWARFTRPGLNPESCDDAMQKARELLETIKGRQVGLFAKGSVMAPPRISDLIEQVPDHQIRAKCMDLLKQIYRHAALCQLDQTCSAIDGQVLDWYQYELCIIVPEAHRGLAMEIKARMRKDKGWRVLLGSELDYPLEEKLQDELLTEVFYSSSWKCLALISGETANETLRKRELNYASRRNQIEGAACSGYLMLVPLDEAGLSIIKNDPFMRECEATLRPIAHLADEITRALAMESKNAKYR